MGLTHRSLNDTGPATQRAGSKASQVEEQFSATGRDRGCPDARGMERMCGALSVGEEWNKMSLERSAGDGPFRDF